MLEMFIYQAQIAILLGILSVYPLHLHGAVAAVTPLLQAGAGAAGVKLAGIAGQRSCPWSWWTGPSAVGAGVAVDGGAAAAMNWLSAFTLPYTLDRFIMSLPWCCAGSASLSAVSAVSTMKA